MTWAQKYAEFLDQLALPSGVRAETAVAHDVPQIGHVRALSQEAFGRRQRKATPYTPTRSLRNGTFFDETGRILLGLCRNDYSGR